MKLVLTGVTGAGMLLFLYRRHEVKNILTASWYPDLSPSSIRCIHQEDHGTLS
jgi:hypothetical protein